MDNLTIVVLGLIIFLAILIGAEALAKIFKWD
jgi:hypothetical protein